MVVGVIPPDPAHHSVGSPDTNSATPKAASAN
ncbi:MAG: hypothetical protein JWM57_167 [Phycisphaerales bacterium]|nr:hypothetical protein [Phycisphaerales bacterium]